MTTRSPTLAETMNRGAARQISRIRVALPARVETYDAATQQVSVQPLIQDGYTDESGERQAERLPVIPHVPVVFPGAGGFRVTFPIAVGDTVLVVFSSSSLDQWLALGGEVDPKDDRRHDLSDAIAIPGLRDFAHALSSAPTSTMSIGKDGGPTIEIGADIQAGGSSELALNSDVAAIVSAISGAAVAAGDGGATFKANIMSALTGIPVGTTVLKGG